MYIVINKYPIDVYKIESISKVCKVSPKTYESCLKVYASDYKKRCNVSDSEISYHSLAKDFMKLDEDKYKFSTTILKRIDEVMTAVTGHGVIKVAATFDPYQYLANDPFGAEEKFPRFLKSSEIDWGILPDTYFFGITYELDIFGGKYSEAKHLYSKLYDNEDDATEARDLLLQAINTVRCEALKVDI